MKILAVMGSPHQGNTLEITRRIEEKLKKLDDVEFEYVHLKDLDIKPCRGCFLCFIKGEENCPLKDDKEMISQKLEEADGVLFVSPVYSMHVSYLFKTFVDRFAYNFHRPPYFGKYAVAVAAAGNPGLNETLKYLNGTAAAWGFQVIGELGYIASPKNTPLPPLIVRKDDTDKVVHKFYRAIKEKIPRKLTFTDYLWFHSMKVIYLKMETMSPVDYKFFKEKGWLEKEAKYFCNNTRGNFIKEIFGRFMGWMTGRQIDKALARHHDKG